MSETNLNNEQWDYLEQFFKDHPDIKDKRKRFIFEYIKDNNAKQAAIRAGYSEKTAKLTGHRLITNDNLSEAIDKLNKLQAKKCAIDAEVLKKKAYEYATADLSKRASERMTLSEQGRFMDMCFKVLGEYSEKRVFEGDIEINVNLVDDDND